MERLQHLSMLGRIFDKNYYSTFVIAEYETYLKKCFVTTSDFKDIVEGKLDSRRRILQLLLMTAYMTYTLPRFSFCCWLYSQDDETRIYYQYILADYFEQLGLFGRVLNFCYPAFATVVVVDKWVLRKFEASNCLQFLTDTLKLLSSQEEDHGLQARDQQKLLKSMSLKITAFKLVMKATAFCNILFDVTAFALFLYNEQPSLLKVLQATSHMVLLIILVKMVAAHFFGVYLAFIITTDYFKARVESLLNRVSQLKSQLSEGTMRCILKDYDGLLLTFKRQNMSLRYLLRNMVSFYCVGLTCTMFALTIQMNLWMRVLMVTVASSYSLCIMMTGMYISQLNSMVTSLYNELNFIAARTELHPVRSLLVKTRLRLRLTIKELGNQETDGQFVIGLTDGSGAATSRLEVVGLTFTTISNVLMAIQFVYY